MNLEMKSLSLEVKDCSKIYLVSKRIFDVVSCGIGMIILLPIYVLVAIAIKVEDPKGNVFYSHSRIGKGGKKIPVYKFRSMYSNSDELFDQFTDEQKAEFEEFQKLKDDPRVTKVGRFIRKSSLDELPQLLNVIKGEMSVVGPRPIVEKELDRYGENKDAYLSVLPGLTGIWQAYGRSDTTYDERVRMDTYYAANRTFILDLKIIFSTIISVITGRGAY